MKKPFLILNLLLAIQIAQAQLSAFNTGAFNGQNAWSVNPAYSNINNYSTVIGAGQFFSYNNVSKIGWSNLVNGLTSIKDFAGIENLTQSQLSNLDLSANVLDANYYPFAFTKKIKKFGFGVATQSNVNILEVRNLNFPVLNLVSQLGSIEDIINNQAVNGNITLNANFKPFKIKPINNYNKISENFSYEALDLKKIKLNVGANLHYYNALVASDFRVNKLDASIKTTTDSLFLSSNGIDATMLLALPINTSNFDLNNNNFSAGDIARNFFNGSGNGVGFDLGATVLIKGSADFHKNKRRAYKYLAGVSVMDIGNLVIKGDNLYGTLKITGSGTIAEKLSDLDTLNSFKEITNYLSGKGFNAQLDTISNIPISLPSRFVMHGDAHLYKNFYAGAFVSVPMVNSLTRFVLTEVPSVILLTPRWESKHFMFMLPVEYDSKTGSSKVGAGLALGPVRFGVNNVTGLFTNFNNLQFYIAAANWAR